VLPQRGDSKVITWPFSDLEAEDKAVSVVDYRVGTEPESYRNLMLVGKVHVQSGREYEDCSIRRIRRVRDIQVVHVEGTDFEEAYKNAGLFRRIGRLIAPGAVSLPG
jgi:hypothetical protein